VKPLTAFSAEVLATSPMNRATTVFPFGVFHAIEADRL
jgi:hypothetical protein